jgi:multisubunit Na+/H+ antiporter MnhE subunit
VYLGLVFSSNVRVAWEVVTPRNDQIREAIVAVPMRVASPSAALLVANSISYTPGSLTVELAGDPQTLYVHVLHFESVEDVVAQVRRLEDLVAAAVNEPLAA